MKVKLADAKRMVAEIYLSTGLDKDSAEWLTELALDYDLEGNLFSGFEEIVEDVKKIDPKLQEVVEVDRPAMKLVSGNGKIAKLVMKAVLPRAIEAARQNGIAFVGFMNCGYHASLSTIARKVAEQGSWGFTLQTAALKASCPMAARRMFLAPTRLRMASRLRVCRSFSMRRLPSAPMGRFV